MRTRPRGSGSSSAEEGNAAIGNLACQINNNTTFNLDYIQCIARVISWAFEHILS